MEDINFLRIVIERSSAINNYWSTYIVITTAILSIMASGRDFTRSNALKAVLTIGFSIFALFNLDAMIELADLRRALLAKDLDLYKETPGIIKSLTPYSNSVYISIHITFDIIMGLGIWLVPWGTRGQAKTPETHTSVSAAITQ